MTEERKDLLMKVDGMSCSGCAAAVTRMVQRLDPGAVVQVDLEHGRVAVRTRAQALEVAEVINRGGYEARAMTL